MANHHDFPFKVWYALLTGRGHREALEQVCRHHGQTESQEIIDMGTTHILDVMDLTVPHYATYVQAIMDCVYPGQYDRTIRPIEPTPWDAECTYFF